jgi:cell shape-determining protein MreC
MRSLTWSPTSKIVTLIVSLVVFFFLEKLSVFPVTVFLGPLQSWQSKNFSLLQKLTQPLYRIQDFWQLRNKFEDLQARYAETSAEAARLRAVEKENQELRSILENTDRRSQESIISSPLKSYAQPLLPVGRENAVKEGDMVIAKQTLLGSIQEVTEKQSSVLLLRQQTEGGILAVTESGVKGLVKGDGRSVLLTEVPKEKTLLVGESVTTLAQPGIDQGIFLGRIQSIDAENPAQANQTAVLDQLTDFYQVAIVEIR